MRLEDQLKRELEKAV